MLLGKLIDTFKNAHPDMDEHEFFAMITADPTIVTNDRGSFCGKYCTWIGNQYVDGKIKVGDAPELRAALLIYDKHKNHLKSIKDVKDLDELIGLIKGLSTDFKPTRCISKGEQGLEKVYEDEEWIVYVPHTFEASRKIGGDTHWCTAASNGQERFDYYTKQGPLYVNIRKSDGEKFQFHFETKSFMDKNDVYILKLENLKMTKGLIAFYRQKWEMFDLFLKFEDVGKFEDGCALVRLNGDYNFVVDKQGKLLSPSLWFNDAFPFFNGTAYVHLNGKSNLITIKGDLLFDWIYDFCSNIIGGFSSVQQNDKWNYVDINGRLLSPNCWFDSANSFYNGFGLVIKGDMSNLIDSNGNLISKQWFNSLINIGHNCYAGFIGEQLYVIQNGIKCQINTKITAKYEQ